MLTPLLAPPPPDTLAQLKSMYYTIILAGSSNHYSTMLPTPFQGDLAMNFEINNVFGIVMVV
jgi:hypothetical protein